MAKDLKTPKISVVMSVYNGEAYVRQAVDSILKQVLADFEFIIIDDGSTDQTAKILTSYSDPRLRLVHQENAGLVAALNTGIGMANGLYVARQDADDISKSNRLSEELSYVQAHPETVIVGSSMEVMDETGKVLHEHRVLLGDAELKQELLVRSPFAHGSVLFSRAAFEKSGGYDQAEWPAEDYGLWLRLAPFGAFGNVDRPLYVYRENSAGTSQQHTSKQMVQKRRLQRQAWQQRRQLIPTRLNLANYEDLVMGDMRVQRVRQNLQYAARRAVLQGDFRTAIHCQRLISKIRASHA